MLCQAYFYSYPLRWDVKGLLETNKQMASKYTLAWQLQYTLLSPEVYQVPTPNTVLA